MSGDVTVHPLQGGGPGVNAFLVVGTETVLIDTGMPGRGAALLAEIERIGVMPTVIVLTHADPDHIGGSNFLRERTQARVYAPAAERGVMEGRKAAAPTLRRLMRRVLLWRQPAPAVDRWVEEGELVGDLKVVSTPGHSRGHISLVAGRTLLAGDAFRSDKAAVHENPRLLDEDHLEARRSIERLAALDPEVAYCGHGPPVEMAASRLKDLVASWGPPTVAPPR